MRTLLLLLTLVCAMATAQAKELKSFSEIQATIQAGKTIRLLINFDNCSPKPSRANLQIYTTPAAILVRTNYLQFANSPLTTNHPDYPNKPILENCTYRITDNDVLNLTTRVITLPDYTVAHESSSVCPLGSAVKVFS